MQVPRGLLYGEEMYDIMAAKECSNLKQCDFGHKSRRTRKRRSSNEGPGSEASRLSPSRAISCRRSSKGSGAGAFNVEQEPGQKRGAGTGGGAWITAYAQWQEPQQQAKVSTAGLG